MADRREDLTENGITLARWTDPKLEIYISHQSPTSLFENKIFAVMFVIQSELFARKRGNHTYSIQPGKNFGFL